jgi:integrase
MPFDNIISRSDAAATIPEDVVAEVIEAAAAQSAALSLFRRVNMGTKITRMPVVSALAQAYFVNGDTGLKQTTEQAWTDVVLEAEEIAALVPIAEAVVDDSGINLWDEVRDGLAEAVGHTLDLAVFMGTDKPATWAGAIVPAAIAAGNTAEAGTSTPEQGSIVGDIDAALDKVEADGFDATAIAAKRSLRGQLRRARDANGQRLAAPAGGTVERMSGDIAAWETGLPERSRYGITGALRQALGAAVRWGYLGSNPATAAGPRRQLSPRPIRSYTWAELEAIAAELTPARRSLPTFAAATGLRPEEWQALERRDVDRRARVLNVLRTVSDGAVVELAKTDGSRRQVPLSMRALAALDAIPARLDNPLLFPALGGQPLNLDNFRRREWSPAVEAAGVPRPARIYDLRSTFASDALAAGVTVFELARIMGTSVRMIERHYGALLDGAGAGIAGRLDALDAERGRAAERATDGGS